MTLLTVVVTSLFLFFIRRSMRAQMTSEVDTELAESLVTFRNLQAERFAALDRENSLLASLPTLKALMTSGDDVTIQDGALEYSELSGNDVFALTAPNGRVVAMYTHGQHAGSWLRDAIVALVADPAKHNLVDNNALYTCSVQPIYFGNAHGTLLGYIISGVSIERTVRQISAPTGVEAAFLSDGRILASTLSSTVQRALQSHTDLLSVVVTAPKILEIQRVRYMVATKSLSEEATAPLQLVVFKSFAPAELWIARIDRTVLTAGLAALVGGLVMMITLARLLTGPLEELSNSVRAFGMGDRRHDVPRYGTREVRQLSAAFHGMREEIQVANQARLESERLATIGRMASSVSHDLRHYLAAVYANAEFLASETLAPEDRADIFTEIRSAVLGTADMIESLLIFSRTGSSLRRSPEHVNSILDRALALLHAHPDAQRVEFRMDAANTEQTIAFLDGKRLERAVYNLLLNACQAGFAQDAVPCVTLTTARLQDTLTIDVEDNGTGVPASIRTRLFEPFVSEGKQKGSGLGLTLVACIAEEHGGDVVLVESAPGKTVFRMRITLVDAPPPASNEQSGEAVSHETIPS